MIEARVEMLRNGGIRQESSMHTRRENGGARESGWETEGHVL